MDADKPVITLAMQTTTGTGRMVWNFYAGDGDQLIGWSPDLPSILTGQPSCFEYGTGAHRAVTFAPGARTVGL